MRKSWLDSPARRPISLRFPLTRDATPYIGLEVHDYFENLLPDTKPIRERLARRFRVAGTPAAIARAQAHLPDPFPARLADSIFAGLQSAANKLAQQPQLELSF